MPVFFRLILLSFVLFLCGCNSPIETVHSEVVYAGMPGKSAVDTIMYDSLDHVTFSRLTRRPGAGLQFYYKLPEELINKHLFVVFEGNIRSNYAQSYASIVVMVLDKDDNQLCWKVCPLSPSLVYQNKWNHFKDSVLLTNVYNGVKYIGVGAFPYLPLATTEKFDIDTFKVTIKRRVGF